MFDIMEWYTKHAKKLDKKYYAKGESIYVLHRRTLQTAKSIIDLINDIPADDLFLELYMLVKDKEFGIFVGRYQYVLEIAKEKPDTFAEQLYEFYLKMAADIKKNNYYQGFQDEDGEIDTDGASEFIKQFIPKKEEWKSILNRVVNFHETVKFLGKISVNINIKNQLVTFRLPDFGLEFKETIIPREVWDECCDELLKSEENWGIIEIGYYMPEDEKDPGKIKLVSYQDFCPYEVSLEDYKSANEDFSLPEWVDIILSAVDYNPEGYESFEQKLTMIQRLLPFVEKRVNLMELAPPGTGKSYLFGQISRYGWLVSGKVTRSKLIYDLTTKKEGVVAFRDYVALDEIREAEYMKDAEIQSALQAIMENGKYRAPDNHEVNVDAGIIFLGNISSDKQNEYVNMCTELPKPFHQPQFLDRIHGFIKGWDLPRMKDDMKAQGWALNSEYFATIMHELRDDASYRVIVDKLIVMPPDSDTRDTEAIKKICTAFLKLLFPKVRKPSDISRSDFWNYCLKPAMDMRAIVRIQMGFSDEKLQGKTVPDFDVEELDEE